jgi:hypothetical protein
MEPAGTLAISGDYVQLASGSLTLALSGSALADATIQIVDEAELAGTLIVESATGFMPTVDAEFELLAALGGVTGEFDDVSLPPLPSGLTWDLSYEATAVLLKIASALPGDYNGDGLVNAADYVVWRKQNATQDGYNTWRDNFGNMLSGSGAARGERSNGAVPEASAAMLSIIAAAGLLILRRADPPSSETVRCLR